MSNKLMVRAGAAAALGALAVATTAVAQNGAPPVNVRGTVVSFSGNALKVKSREGKAVDVALPTGWRLSSVANTTLESIKPGDFVGIASVPNAKGDRALEVLVFPPELKGAGEGSYGWDLKPKSNMTNASVSNLVKGVNGRTVTLTYGGQQKTITIPERTPIVTIAPATNSDLKPGAVVFVSASMANGVLTGRQVVVGKNGVVPPM